MRALTQQALQGLLLQHPQRELLAERVVRDTGELSQGLVNVFGAGADADPARHLTGWTTPLDL